MDDRKPRGRSPRGQGQNLKVELLDAAAELMAQHGSIDKVGIRAVAAEVGVSPTAVYRHFDNLDDLLWSAVEHCWSEFRDAMAAGFSSSTDPYVAFRAGGDAYVRFASTQPGKYRVLFSNRVPLPERELPVAMEAYGMLVGSVAAVLAASGDDRDPTFVAAEVHTWIHGIVDLVVRHEGGPWPPVETLLDSVCTELRMSAPT